MVDILFSIVVIFLGFNIPKLFAKKLIDKDFIILKRLWIFHLLFGIIYFYYVKFGPGGDSITYFEVSNQISFSQGLTRFLVHGPGTYALYLLNQPIAQVLGFFGMTLMYSCIGYLGFVIYYILFKEQVIWNTRILGKTIFPLILFLPNLHFWSAGLGKDTILFTCIACFFYGVLNIKKRLIFVIIALVLSYLVRPHITMFLIISFGFGYALDSQLKSYQKGMIFTVFLIGFVMLFDNVMAYLKIEELSTDAFTEFSSVRVDNLSKSSTGSSVDISSYPLPLKIFTFLYRPLFFDINGVLAIVASFENLILLVLSFKFLKSNPLRVFKNGGFFIKGMFFFLIIGSVSFSLILGNLGIMLRQKNMFIPILIFLCLYAMSEKYQSNLKLVNESV